MMTRSFEIVKDIVQSINPSDFEDLYSEPKAFGDIKIYHGMYTPVINFYVQPTETTVIYFIISPEKSYKMSAVTFENGKQISPKRCIAKHLEWYNRTQFIALVRHTVKQHAKPSVPQINRDQILGAQLIRAIRNLDLSKVSSDQALEILGKMQDTINRVTDIG